MRAELEFDSFYAATRPRLLQQLTIVTLDREQAADALQEAYVRAWQRWERLVQYDDAESWVRTVAYRRCVSHWRRLATARRAAPRVAVADTVDAVATAEVVAVRQALALLSPEHRAVLVLHELCDLSVEEIAHQLRIPRGTMKSRLSRGRTALAGLLTDPATGRPPAFARGAHDGRPRRQRRFRVRRPGQARRGTAPAVPAPCLIAASEASATYVAAMHRSRSRRRPRSGSINCVRQGLVQTFGASARFFGKESSW